MFCSQGSEGNGTIILPRMGFGFLFFKCKGKYPHEQSLHKDCSYGDVPEACYHISLKKLGKRLKEPRWSTGIPIVGETLAVERVVYVKWKCG